MDAGSNAELKAQIDATLADIKQLPAFPAVVSRALAMAGDPDADVKALADEISRDAAITAAVIKLSNSSYYSPQQKIRSVHEAIMALGLRTVKDIIIVATSRGILNVPMTSYKMEESALWDHSLLVAEVANRIAKQKKTKTPSDVAFTAGLLHDIGKVIMVRFFQKIYRQLSLDMEKEPSTRFTDLERKYLGYSHNELGSKLLKTWNFPEELVEAVEYHYTPDKSKVNPELCSIVHIANVVVLSGGVGIDIGGLSEPLSSFALQKLNLSDAELKSLYDFLPELQQQILELRSI